MWIKTSILELVAKTRHRDSQSSDATIGGTPLGSIVVVAGSATQPGPSVSLLASSSK
jgi:hypothetical protein